MFAIGIIPAKRRVYGEFDHATGTTKLPNATWWQAGVRRRVAQTRLCKAVDQCTRASRDRRAQGTPFAFPTRLRLRQLELHSTSTTSPVPRPPGHGYAACTSSLARNLSPARPDRPLEVYAHKTLALVRSKAWIRPRDPIAPIGNRDECSPARVGGTGHRRSAMVKEQRVLASR